MTIKLGLLPCVAMSPATVCRPTLMRQSHVRVKEEGDVNDLCVVNFNYYVVLVKGPAKCLFV